MNFLSVPLDNIFCCGNHDLIEDEGESVGNHKCDDKKPENESVHTNDTDDVSIATSTTSPHDCMEEKVDVPKKQLARDTIEVLVDSPKENKGDSDHVYNYTDVGIEISETLFQQISPQAPEEEIEGHNDQLCSLEVQYAPYSKEVKADIFKEKIDVVEGDKDGDHFNANANDNAEADIVETSSMVSRENEQLLSQSPIGTMEEQADEKCSSKEQFLVITAKEGSVQEKKDIIGDEIGRGSHVEDSLSAPFLSSESITEANIDPLVPLSTQNKAEAEEVQVVQKQINASSVCEDHHQGSVEKMDVQNPFLDELGSQETKKICANYTYSKDDPKFPIRKR